MNVTLLQVDFSENVTILEQNEGQSAHWTHKQVTILTVLLGLINM